MAIVTAAIATMAIVTVAIVTAAIVTAAIVTLNGANWSRVGLSRPTHLFSSIFIYLHCIIS